MSNKISFENWCDIFLDSCSKLGYNGPIDLESFESEYMAGKTPEWTAEDFVKEMND